MFSTSEFPYNSNIGPYNLPFLEVYIDEIKVSGKYTVVGTVVAIGEDKIGINDGTGEMNIIPPSTFDISSLKEGAQIRCLGYVDIVPEKVLNAITIHNLSNVDIDLYQRVRELEKSVFFE